MFQWHWLKLHQRVTVNLLGSIAQLVAYLAADPGNRKFESHLGHITLVNIDHELFSLVIHTILQIQEGQLSVTGESMCMTADIWLRRLPAKDKVSVV